MGLRPGDVVVRVNGALVLDDGTRLFEALASPGPIRVEVLRRGLPQTFEYRVK